jgi:hypothetical protein
MNWVDSGSRGGQRVQTQGDVDLASEVAEEGETIGKRPGGLRKVILHQSNETAAVENQGDTSLIADFSDQR